MNITGTTTVFGIFGDPVGHSMSPLMQNAAIEKMGYDGVYVPFHVHPEQLEAAVWSISSQNIRGINVTVPHKTTVMPHLDILTEAACAVGAVNTIINDDGALIGDNTDVYGFVQGLLREDGIDAFPSSVCVIGAGGAARGAIYGCTTRDEVEEIFILNRTVEKAVAIANEFETLTAKRITALPMNPHEIMKVFSKAGLIVNTTSIGMHPNVDRTPVEDTSVFHSGHIVYDIIIPPLETRFLKEAAKRGARTVGGLAMLAYQGARSLSLWTGQDAPE
ncbi:shikimate dehydrogenase, partial [Candidatus Latescibacterota bacterium]